jgi:hypothetical protein
MADFSKDSSFVPMALIVLRGAQITCKTSPGFLRDEMYGLEKIFAMALDIAAIRGAMLVSEVNL